MTAVAIYISYCSQAGYPLHVAASTTSPIARLGPTTMPPVTAGPITPFSSQPSNQSSESSKWPSGGNNDYVIAIILPVLGIFAVILIAILNLLLRTSSSRSESARSAQPTARGPTWISATISSSYSFNSSAEEGGLDGVVTMGEVARAEVLPYQGLGGRSDAEELPVKG
jgi:hypothetical protein